MATTYSCTQILSTAAGAFTLRAPQVWNSTYGLSIQVNNGKLYLLRYNIALQTVDILEYVVTAPNFGLSSNGTISNITSDGYVYVSSVYAGTGAEAGKIFYNIAKFDVATLALVVNKSYGTFTIAFNNGWTNAFFTIANTTALFMLSNSSNSNYSVDMMSFNVGTLDCTGRYTLPSNGFQLYTIDESFIYGALQKSAGNYVLAKIDLAAIVGNHPKAYFNGTFNGVTAKAEFSSLVVDGLSLYGTLASTGGGKQGSLAIQLAAADFSLTASGPTYTGGIGGMVGAPNQDNTYFYPRYGTQKIKKSDLAMVAAIEDRAPYTPSSVMIGNQILLGYHGTNYPDLSDRYGLLTITDASVLLKDSYESYNEVWIARSFLTDWGIGVDWIDYPASYGSAGVYPPATDVTAITLVPDGNLAVGDYGGVPADYSASVSTATNAYLDHSKVNETLYLLDVSTGTDGRQQPSTDILISHIINSAPPNLPMYLFTLLRDGVNPYNMYFTYDYVEVTGVGVKAVTVTGYPLGAYHATAYMNQWSSGGEHTGAEEGIVSVTAPVVQTNAAVII